MTISDKNMDPPVPAASERDDLMREVADLRRQLAKHELAEISLSESNAALHRSEAQFSRIFQQSPICLGISDIESGELFRVNDIWCETFGYTPEEAIGKTTVALGLLRPDDSQREALLDVLKKDGTVRNFEARMLTKDGQILTVLYSCDPIEYEGATRLYTTITDITQRAETKRLFEVAFESNPEIVTITNAQDGRFINVNKRFWTITA
ncbi:MAG: PAS domain S-box protein [Alphaproteobacteria bacterium]